MPDVSDKELIEAVESTESPFAIVPDVAEQVGLSENRIRTRLNRLVEEDGLLESHSRPNVTIYWVPDSVSK